MFYDLTWDHSDFPQELAEGDPGPGPTGATPQTVGLSLEMRNQPVNKAEVSILSLFRHLSKKAQGKQCQQLYVCSPGKATSASPSHSFE